PARTPAINSGSLDVSVQNAICSYPICPQVSPKRTVIPLWSPVMGARHKARFQWLMSQQARRAEKSPEKVFNSAVIAARLPRLMRHEGKRTAHQHGRKLESASQVAVDEHRLCVVTPGGLVHPSHRGPS